MFWSLQLFWNEALHTIFNYYVSHHSAVTSQILPCRKLMADHTSVCYDFAQSQLKVDLSLKQNKKKHHMKNQCYAKPATPFHFKTKKAS